MKLIHETDIGVVRQSNEDHCWSGKNDKGHVLLIVCDGLGSYKGSKIASKIVVDTFIDSFLDYEYKDSLQKWFASNVEKSRKLFAVQVRRDPIKMQMSTTIVLALVKKSSAHVFWMGDSRGYLLTQDGGEMITHDHNLKNKLIAENASPVTMHRFKEHLLGITSYIGIAAGLQVGYQKIKVPKDSILILTSDGLHNFLDMNQIYWEFKKSTNIIKSSKEIIKTTIKNKSDDNISFSAMLNFDE